MVRDLRSTDTGRRCDDSDAVNSTRASIGRCPLNAMSSSTTASNDVRDDEAAGG